MRQMRLLTDGHKRRPPAAAPPPKTAASLAKQSSGSLTSDSNAVVRRRDRSPAFRRPQRKVGRPSCPWTLATQEFQQPVIDVLRLKSLLDSVLLSVC